MLAQSLFSTKFDLKASKLNKFGLKALFHKNTRSQCNKMYRYQLEVFFIPNLSLKLPNWPTIELKNYFLWKQVFLGSLQLDVCFLLNIHPRCHLIYCSAFSIRLKLVFESFNSSLYLLFFIPRSHKINAHILDHDYTKSDAINFFTYQLLSF